MGVCGCGKSSFGYCLSGAIGATFIEGDTLHPPANIDKMSKGIPLTDKDRLPWLESIVSQTRTLLDTGQSVVVACSALKLSYRQMLRQIDNSLHFAHLCGNREIIEDRMNNRIDHFMPMSLLESQINTLQSTANESDVIELNLQLPTHTNVQLFLQRAQFTKSI